MYIGRIVESGTTARDKVKAGVDKGCKAIASTFGPFGTNALIEKGLRITNDGASIAREIEFQDELEDLGWRKVREAANKSNDMVGDGSTTVFVLAPEVLDVAVKQLPNDKRITGRMTTASLIKKLGAETDEIIAKLEETATPVETEEQLINSATVSVEDRTLGELIGKEQFRLGKDGYILAELANQPGVTVEQIQGIRIDNGLGAAQLMNNMERQSLEIENTRILLTNHTIESLAQANSPLLKLLTDVSKSGPGAKVVIVARAFTNEAVQHALENITKGGLPMYPINAPYEDQREVMKDMAALMGGNFIDHEVQDLEDVQLSDLGWCTKLVAHRYDAVFAGVPKDENLTKRIEELEEQLKGSESDFEKKNLVRRIAQLKNGFSLIKVGGESDTERKRVFDKVEDAVNATRVAYQHGTVKGAGLAFKEIADALPDSYLLKKPLTSLYTQLHLNAPEDFVVEDWVRDPVKVLTTALEQAVSVAGDLATVSIAVHAKRVRHEDAPAKTA